MPITVLTANGTTQLKNGTATLQSITVSSPGTAWTLQVNDGSNQTGGASRSILGATPFAVPAIGTVMRWPNPGLPFNNGLQIVLAGTTPGEIAVEWT